MQIFGFDVLGLAIMIGFVIVYGSVFISAILFRDLIPFFPRKYYKVKLKAKDGRFLRYVKAWKVTRKISGKRVDYLRICLKGLLGRFQGVETEIDYLKGINEEGELAIMEEVPDLIEANNYRLAEVPLTQPDRFVEDVVGEVLAPLCTVSYKEGEEIRQGVDSKALEFYKLKVKDALNRNSRIKDLNQSEATRARIQAVRQEEDRKKGAPSFMDTYGNMIIVGIACLFAFLIMDGSIKATQATAAQQSAIMEHGYSQVIEQCGGLYVPLNKPQANNTTASTNILPFGIT